MLPEPAAGAEGALVGADGVACAPKLPKPDELPKVGGVSVLVDGERGSQAMGVGLDDVTNEQYCLRVQERLSELGVEAATAEALIGALLQDARDGSLLRGKVTVASDGSVRPPLVPDQRSALLLASDVAHKSSWRYGDAPNGEQARRERLLDVAHVAYLCDRDAWEDLAAQLHALNDTELAHALEGSPARPAGLALYHVAKFEAEMAPREPGRVFMRLSGEGQLQALLLERLSRAEDRRLRDLLNRAQRAADDAAAGEDHTRPPEPQPAEAAPTGGGGVRGGAGAAIGAGVGVGAAAGGAAVGAGALPPADGEEWDVVMDEGGA
mmetsp:Transcript_41348/g.109689  ORF Transcript_41348/g.109689 Transcript_41348/m.109689 type:complete len:324 (-) Transcript_41348:179-1150(-)